MNFWSLHSASANISGRSNVGGSLQLDYDDMTDNSSTPSTISSRAAAALGSASHHHALASKESKLIELNLSNNRFTKVPECLSCLAPKLVKLNLASNRIESMGAVCDLPASIKFLDLSNNRIKRSMRLLNENLLRFILFYFSKMSSNPSAEEFNLNNLFVNLLLGNLRINIISCIYWCILVYAVLLFARK